MPRLDTLALALGVIGVMALLAVWSEHHQLYYPKTYSEIHIKYGLTNRLGDKDFKCIDSACDPLMPFEGEQTGRRYMNKDRVSQGIAEK